MPILSFSSNDIDVITGKRPEPFVRHGRLLSKKATDYTAIGIWFPKRK